MQINQTVISNAIELALNWLTEQVAGRIDVSKLQTNGSPLFPKPIQDMDQYELSSLCKLLDERILNAHPNLLRIIESMTPEQKMEFHQYIEDCIAASSRVLDLRFLDTEQSHALGRIIESYIPSEREIKNMDLDIPSDDDIREEIGSYSWEDDSSWESAVESKIGSYDWERDDEWKHSVQSIVSDALENDDGLEDSLRKVFQTSSVLETAISDYPSNFREALRFDDAVREFVDQYDFSETIEQEVSKYLSSISGKHAIEEAVGDLIDERVSAKMRSIFQALERNI